MIGQRTEETKESVIPAELTNEQWATVLNLLNSRNSRNDEKMTGKENFHWIIDLGATQHMTGKSKCLSKLKQMFGCQIGLPDGSQVMASQKGSSNLSKHIRLKNVLAAPGLKFDLISVSQLTDESKCNVLFTDKLCLIQDRISRMVIGTGERCKGLYYFKNGLPAQALKAGTIYMFNLWHRRMGHPSSKIVGLISGDRELSSNKSCDICLKAKQTRETFSSSDNAANEIFDLIHCDLWGPYRVPSSSNASYFLIIIDDVSRCVWIYLLIDKTEVG